VVETYNKGTYTETGMKTIQGHWTSAWKMAENDMETADTERREIEDNA
jgi:hypothetical protein